VIHSSEYYTEWQQPLSVVYSLMMEKLAQAGEGHSTYHSRTKFQCTLQLNGQISPYFISTNTCTMWYKAQISAASKMCTEISYGADT
jgi:hypothetical protein